MIDKKMITTETPFQRKAVKRLLACGFEAGKKPSAFMRVHHGTVYLAHLDFEHVLLTCYNDDMKEVYGVLVCEELFQSELNVYRFSL